MIKTKTDYSKTVEQWFKTLDSPYREEALANTDKESLKYKCGSLCEALSGAFVWAKSPQYNLYWSKLMRELKTKKQTI